MSRSASVAARRTHESVAAESSDLALKFPHVERLVSDGRESDADVALLPMEEVELLEKVETGSCRRLHRVELLQASLEAERLHAEEDT